jgi:hypothetical protein
MYLEGEKKKEIHCINFQDMLHNLFYFPQNAIYFLQNAIYFPQNAIYFPKNAIYFILLYFHFK